MEENPSSDSVTVTIPRDTAQAIWAAMHDDDDLAEDYVNIACIHSLNHLVAEMSPEHYTLDEWERLRRNLVAARNRAELGQEEMTARWRSYNEPPF